MTFPQTLPNLFSPYATDGVVGESDLVLGLAHVLDKDPHARNQLLGWVIQPTASSQAFEGEITIALGNVNSVDIEEDTAVYLVNLQEYAPTQSRPPLSPILVIGERVLVVIQAGVAEGAPFQHLSHYANQETLIVKRLTWAKLMGLLAVHSTEGGLGRDFVALLTTALHSPESPTTLAQLSLAERQSRLVQGLKAAHLNPLQYADRTGLAVPYRWAQELLFGFRDEVMTVHVFPGNTKAQGHHIDYDNKAWMDKPGLNVHGKQYPIHRLHHVRFASWKKYIGGLWFGEEIKGGFKNNGLYTSEAWHRTGFWHRDDWDAFEAWLDPYFDQNTYDWRAQCGWGGKAFHESGRTRFAMTIGYEVWIEIPLVDLPPILSHKNDAPQFADFIDQVELAFRGLLQ